MKHHSPLVIPKEYITALNLDLGGEIFAKFLGHTENKYGHFFMIQDSIKPIDEKYYNSYLFLYHYDLDMKFVHAIKLDELEDELDSIFCQSDGSLISFPSGEIMFTTTLNRAYIFDSQGKKIIKSFNSIIKNSFDGKDKFKHLIVDTNQEMFERNLFMRGAVCPDNQQLLTLVDSLPHGGVNQKTQRGDLIGISEKPLSNINKKLELQLIDPFFNKYPDDEVDHFSYSIIKKKDGKVFSLEDHFTIETIEKRIENDFDDVTIHNPFPDTPIALGNGLFLLPIFNEMYRSGSRGNFFTAYFIDSDGNFSGHLKGFDFREDSPYAQEQFQFAAFRESKRIFYKNTYGVYLFDYEGNCVEKYYFTDPEVKSLKPFRLISSTNDSYVILFHEKNNEFLTISLLNNNLKSSIIEAISNFKKEKKAEKKEWFFLKKGWYEKNN